MGYAPVSGRLHTRYSPVRRSPSQYCYRMLPLDLHVLSLSLAFILSQDQTLHSNKTFFNYILRPVIISVEFLLGLALAVCFKPFNILKNYFSFHVLPPLFRSESGCKDNIISTFPPNIFTSFFKLFFRITAENIPAPIHHQK